MSDNLNNPSPAQLVTAIEENLFAWIPVFGKLGRTYVNDPAGVKRSTTDIPSALFNSIMDAQLATGQVDETVRFIISDARSRNVPVLWWTGPSTQPADLGKYLVNCSFTIEDEAPGMAVVLAKLHENLPTPDGLSILLAQNDVSWRQWSKTLASGFEVPASADFVVDAWHDLLRSANPETTLAYIGWLNEKPVATSLLLLAAGVAGIYSVSTIPQARRKGIGALMTLYPLRQAHSMGYEIGIIHSSEMGFNVYRSLGFEEYCKIFTYRWQPDVKKPG
jgi:hypothetical protein